MYKVIIVEDEELIRKGLIFTINWEEIGTIVVGEAENGVKGLELIKELNPDIIITDVNMPLMDGIEMIKNSINDFSYQSIVISGYDEFEYVKGAMSVGSVDYILKPFSQEDIIKAIHKAIKKIKQVRLFDSSINLGEQIQTLKLSLISNCEDKIVNKMLKYVHENYHKKVVLFDVSKCLNYSETSLKRKFKSAMTITFNNYLNTYRIKKAIELGMNSDYSIQEISSKSGFSNYKYFSVVFKKYTNYNAKYFFEHIKKG